MELNKDAILEAAKLQIAGAIVKGLTPEMIENILTKSVASVIADYSFKREVEQSIMKIAMDHIKEYLEKPHVQTRIKEEAEIAASQFALVLKQAVILNIARMFDHQGNQYSKPEVWNRMREILDIK